MFHRKNYWLFLLLSLASFTSLSAQAKSLVEALPGVYRGLDSEALGRSLHQSCTVRIRTDGETLNVTIRIPGKGILQMGYIHLSGLQKSLVEGTEFRKKQDPNMDPHRLTASYQRALTRGHEATLNLGWTDGRLTDLSISTWPERHDLYCTSLEER